MLAKPCVLLGEQIAIGGHIHDIGRGELIRQENAIRGAGQVQLIDETEIDGHLVRFARELDFLLVGVVDGADLLDFLREGNTAATVVRLVDNQTRVALGELINLGVLRLLLVALDVLQRAEHDDLLAALDCVRDSVAGAVGKVFRIEEYPVIAEVGEVDGVFPFIVGVGDGGDDHHEVDVAELVDCVECGERLAEAGMGGAQEMMAAVVDCVDDVVDAYLLVRTRNIRLRRGVVVAVVLAVVERRGNLAGADSLAELFDCLADIVRVGSVVRFLRVVLACGKILAGNLLPAEVLLSVCVDCIVAEECLVVDVGGPEVAELDLEPVLIDFRPFHLAAERGVGVAYLAGGLAVGEDDVELITLGAAVTVDNLLEILDTVELAVVVLVCGDVDAHISYRFPGRRF